MDSGPDGDHIPDHGLDTAADMPGELGADMPVQEAGTDISSETGPLPDLAVDTLSDAPPPPSNYLCATPDKVTLIAGKATITGDTTHSVNEFSKVSCNNTLGPWAGPQLYYKVGLSAGKGYRVVLSPTGTGFDGALYAFPASTSCSESAIDSACAGFSSDKIGSGKEQLVLTPSTSEDWILVVDSYDSSERGPFTLTVEEVTLPANTVCSNPQAISLSGGKGSVSADTSLSVDEFSKVDCGGSSGPWPGPQLYFKIDNLDLSKHYKVTLTPTGGFDGALYAFPSSTACSEAAINSACTGFWADQPGSTSEAVILTPSAVSSYVIVVDSWNASAGGPFTLAVEEVTLPANTTCANATPLSLGASGSVTVKGDSALSKDEFPALTCGMSNALDGPQLYYKIDLAANSEYTVNLASDVDAQLYVFTSSACTMASIDADCKSGGQNGDVAGVLGKTPTDLLVRTSAAVTLFIGVDSTAKGGSFTLTLSELTVPTFTAPFSFSFDGDCKGLAATNDWECGTLAFSAGAGCDPTGVKGPTTAHSGAGAWGTALNDCYTPYGNNAGSGNTACANSAPNDDSILKLKVALPGTWTQASLTYYSWEDLWTYWDWIEVRVDGKTAAGSQVCVGTYKAPTAWVKRTVDLSAHVGTTVEVAFHMMASTYTNYAGWYIDDLSVSGS